MKSKKSFTDFIKNSLNKEQQKAVKHKKGPLLVRAGAGSGKTRVITARIANLLLQENVQPDQIVALTFTNKASREMSERIMHFLEDKSSIPFIGTFHSFGLFLLKQNQQLLDLPFFTIMDADDRVKLLSDIIKRNNATKKISAKQLSYAISQLKNRGLINNEQLKNVDPLLQTMFRTYEQEKKLSKCFDFDDLLINALKLFDNKEFQKDFQARVKHILVDEYQDTNVVQHQLLKQMAKQNKKFVAHSLCVVGDEDQSIYSWRGATVENIIDFKKDFAKTTEIKIEQNYRSAKPILDLANQVIKENANRNPKSLWSTIEGKDRIRGLICTSEYQEAQAVAQCLQAAKTKDSTQSMAILYRAHFQSRAIEEACIKFSIPYKIIGGVQFYERKEIKDLLAHLRLLVNPFDRPSLFRIINTPARGLGKKLEEQVFELWKQEPFLNFSQILCKLIDAKGLTKVKAQSLKQFLTIFDGLDSNTNPNDALDQIIQRSGYLAYLKNNNDDQDANARIENISELRNAIAHFQSNGIDSIEKLLYEVALMQEHKKDNEQQEPILLMTLHAAKGLEFDVVSLIGLEDGILPSSRSMQEDNTEEERRLFYVGITRAKRYLLISRSRYRYTYGTMNDQRPSRFIQTIGNDDLPWQDASYWSTSQSSLYFADWFGLKETMPEVLTFSTAKQIKTPSKKTSGKIYWKKNQPVSHKTFGIGIVQKIEKRSNKTYITAKFIDGIKKVDATFLKKI